MTRAENIEGAQSVGLSGHHYVTVDGLETFLRSCRLI